MTVTLVPACCNVPAVSATYEPTGSTIHVLTTETNDYYVAPAAPTNKAVIFVHDAFGVSPQAKQATDLLAKALKVHAILPDFYRSKKVPFAEGRESIVQFLGQYGNYDKIVKADLIAVVKWLKETHGVDSVAVVGLCWGGLIVFRLGGDAGSEGLEAIKGVATAHPSMLDPAYGAKLQVPVALLPSKDEDAKLMEDVFEAVSKNPKASEKSIHQRFDDMHHGWVGARGDYTIEQQKERATEALNIIASFFRTVF
ncbi:hypothetical protein HDU99_003077 [Rhizoclosmatium hyalinum]|nr:hypothetical protein HDU99_003077 [Rhizoclosmatium hyalinum]